jgi:tetratricopeptide (TPR) repeat protein
LTQTDSSAPSPRRGALLRAIAALVALAAPRFAVAHPVIDDHLRVLNQKIAAEPDNARLYVSRGNVHLDDGETVEALENFDRALELDPTLHVAHYLRSQALLAQGQPALALDAARRFVALEPETAKGWKAVARAADAAAIATNRPVPEEALAAFERFFALARDPRPDDYLARAELLARAGRVDEAVRGLDAGVERLGPLTALLGRALDMERASGDPAAALRYARRLVETSPQVERWLLESARLEAALGRQDAARATLERARRALAARPKRSAGVWQELDREITTLQTQLDAPGGATENGR